MDETNLPVPEVNELTTEPPVEVEVKIEPQVEIEVKIEPQVEIIVEPQVEVKIETEIIVEPVKNVFDFIKNPEKLKSLIRTNELLKINTSKHNRLVFVYSCPKVGSTSIVSSLRIFGSDKVDIIHIHNEDMLRVLGHTQDITINELILFNKYLGKNVYVINIYRSPIERKISTFFEKIGTYHFNASDETINKYDVNKVIKRFNDIFPYIGLGDHFMDKYEIKIPSSFEHNQKYLLVKENDITYITLRLKDSTVWGNILSDIFGFKICTVKDYESSNKPIKNIYMLFKSHYKIPTNLLDTVMNCKYLNYYYSSSEKNIYYNEWLSKSTDIRNSYTLDEYTIYEDITNTNYNIDYVQSDHYMDEGCGCKACNIKRIQLASKIAKGIPTNERIVHTEAKTELITRRVNQVNRINNAIRNMPPRPTRGKDFKQSMHNVLIGKIK